MCFSIEVRGLIGMKPSKEYEPEALMMLIPLVVTEASLIMPVCP